MQVRVSSQRREKEMSITTAQPLKKKKAMGTKNVKLHVQVYVAGKWKV